MTQIIAEMGVDHEGSWDRAKALLNIATRAGADAFKTQHFRPGTRGPNRELPTLKEDQLHMLKGICDQRDICFLCTPHDEWALNFLLDSGLVPAMKIGSGGWALIEKAQKRAPELPLIISTGMHNQEEILSLAERLKPEDTLMHCVSEYPFDTRDAYLRFIATLFHDTKVQVGYSDHYSTTALCLAAAGMGVSLIEKHICLEQRVEGRQDTFCSASSDEFKALCEGVRAISQALTKGGRTQTSGEWKTFEWVSERDVLNVD